MKTNNEPTEVIGSIIVDEIIDVGENKKKRQKCIKKLQCLWKVLLNSIQCLCKCTSTACISCSNVALGCSNCLEYVDCDDE